MREAKTGAVVDEAPLHEVKGDNQTIPVNIDPNIAHGKYVLTVWGGLDDTKPLGDDPTTIDFLPPNTECRDIYMTNDTLLFDPYHYDYTVELERTKGKLIIEKVNLPEEIEASTKNITGLYAGVNNEFKYTGETSVCKQADLSLPNTQYVTKTILTPSLKSNASKVAMSFHTAPGVDNTLYATDEVSITMHRNELTVLRYEWDTKKSRFNIYILINDSWDLLNSLSID